MCSSDLASSLRTERLSGEALGAALTALATRLHTDAKSATDQPKVHKLAAAVGELASAGR